MAKQLKTPQRYGPKRIQLQELTRRSRLSHLWQLELPEWLTEALIAEAELLDVKLAAQPGRKFEDFVLETFFSPFLAQLKLPLHSLGLLLKSYEAQPWTAASQRPAVAKVFRDRLQQWADQAADPGATLIIRGLQQSPTALTRQLATFKALSRYPAKIGQRVMADDFEQLKALEEKGLDLSQVTVSETQLGSASDHIRVYLEQLTRSTDPTQALKTLLVEASGCLGLEFEIAQHLLRSEQVTVDDDLVRQVRGLFAPLDHRPDLEQALADLNLLISKPPPPAPNPNPDHPWTDEQWLTWATTHYLPYRFWLEETGELNGDIVGYANAYADWLYHRYPAMRLNSQRLIYQALPALRSKMMQAAPVLVLVIDNFNPKFFPDFSRYMQRQGYYNEALSYYISMLPSCTEISKKCLLSGQPEPFKGTAYKKPVEETWHRHLPGKRVCYLPHVGALRAIKARQHDLYVLNYLPLDLSFHQDESHTGISHAQAARSYLRAIARDVRAFGERIGAARDLMVIVAYDHGSTRIPAQAPNLIDPAFFAKRVQDKHHRYVCISQQDLAQLPDNIHYQCYTFERDRFDLPHNFLADTENSYIHGGLTPEETLIPVALFSPQTITPKALTIRLLDYEFYYERKSTIRLELVNVNNYPSQAMRVEIQNPNIDTLAVNLADLQAMSDTVVTLEGRFRRSRGIIDALQMRVTYTFLEQPYQQDEETAITMKSMMQQAFDMDDLF